MIERVSFRIREIDLYFWLVTIVFFNSVLMRFVYKGGMSLLSTPSTDEHINSKRYS